MTVRNILIGAAIALAVLAAPARASVKDGVELWSKGDYAKAVAQWQGPAARGDADAQFNLAQAFKLGKGVKPDLKKAESLYLRAAEQGHLQASDTYGLVLFQSGRRELAMPWLGASADRGEPRALYILGIAHFNGDLAAKDPVRAYALMSRAASSGLPIAGEALARMDQTLPLDQRQRGVALAAELEARASQTRAAQLAALGLGTRTPKAGAAVAQVAFTGKVAETLKPEAVTAGADFANPVVLGAKPSVPVRKAEPAVAKVASAPPSAQVAADGAWRVQLGAFGVAGNAQALWGRLKASAALAGRRPYYVPAGKLTRLLAGPFGSRGEAQAACGRLAGQACIPVGD